MNNKITITLAICTIASIAALVGLFIPALSTSTPTPNAETALADPVVQQISIENFSFSGPSTAKPGERIAVSNADGAPHTFTARNGSFDTGVVDGGSQTTVVMPETPGTYEFFCSLHPSMVSTITVQS